MNNTRRLWLMTLMSLGTVFSYGIGAEEEGSNKEELKVADEFKRGDVVSADTFNQIFRTIEKINKQAEDDDLVGTWTCNALTTRNTGISGWENKGLFYVLEDAQVNFISSGDNDSQTSPYTVTTSSPSPIRISEDAFSGTYSLVKNTLFTKFSGDTQSRIFSIDIVSPRKIELVFQETSAQSFPANYASYIDCVVANAVPASPTSPSATNNKTSIELAWTDASTDETGFNIYRVISGEETASLLAQVTESPYSDDALDEGQAASYYIASYNDNGESAKSKVVTATLDSIAPTLVSTSPANGDDIATDDRQLTLTFNEKVEVFCPSDPSAGYGCATDARAVTGNWLDDRGKERTFSIGTINSGFGGSLTISGSMMGSAELFGANQSVTATVNKAVIRDVNGNVMESDYEFTFTVNNTQNNSNCPPNC